MAIKRYFATKDNTITNAYRANLTTRGVSGNMGQSDILETFHIYGQASSASSENSRILIDFDIDQVSSDRTAGTIPVSGSVNFLLRLYNAEHSQTTPKEFTLVASAVSQSWDEGLGLDMEDYRDEDSSNWLYATEVDTYASASITVRDNSAPGADNVLHFTGSTANYEFIAKNDSTPGPNEFDLAVSSATSVCAANLATIINTSASADFSANSVGAIVYITASIAGTDANSNSLSSSVPPSEGGTDCSFFSITGSYDANQDGCYSSASFAGGSPFTKWATEGGDYITGSDAAPLEYTFTQFFDNGFENLEIDVSHLVEDWIADELDEYGFGIQLNSTLEAATDSYYTKMFFARGSQFFFKRPVIEARWDNSKKDNRGSFYLSSSLVPAADNLMNLYLYNVVRGNLTDIPAVGTNDILVSVYSGSTVPTGDKLFLPVGGDVVATGDVNITASWVETGIYSASFAYVSSSITKIYDVWHSDSVEYHTGSAVSILTYDSQNYNFDQKYVSNVVNLRATYSTDETARFRLYVRQKDWSPTIYNVASTDIETSIIEDAYYKVIRTTDDLEVISFGTGSLNHTRLSYDASGSYFDLDMSLFDTDTSYEMSFAYLINGSYVEQPERFRFRVE
jgi:hypothetical protein